MPARWLAHWALRRGLGLGLGLAGVGGVACASPSGSGARKDGPLMRMVTQWCFNRSSSASTICLLSNSSSYFPQVGRRIWTQLGARVERAY